MTNKIGVEEAINRFLSGLPERDRWRLNLARYLVAVRAEWNGLTDAECEDFYPAALNFATAILNIVLSERPPDA